MYIKIHTHTQDPGNMPTLCHTKISDFTYCFHYFTLLCKHSKARVYTTKCQVDFIIFCARHTLHTLQTRKLTILGTLLNAHENFGHEKMLTLFMSLNAAAYKDLKALTQNNSGQL